MYRTKRKMKKEYEEGRRRRKTIEANEKEKVSYICHEYI
jgi:hypothetical protein